MQNYSSIHLLVVIEMVDTAVESFMFIMMGTERCIIAISPHVFPIMRMKFSKSPSCQSFQVCNINYLNVY